VSGSYLLLGLGEERYALRVEDVLEVGTLSNPSPLPGAPPGVIGLQNLRGDVLPLLDLASLVGAGPRDRGDAMVVVEQGGRRAALAVDALLDVVPLEDERAGRDEAAPLRSSVLIGGSLVGVLDTKALLDGVKAEAAR
jgi:chemotaxis signal transduction protein